MSIYPHLDRRQSVRVQRQRANSRLGRIMEGAA
jgi:hypothetical protein